MSVEIERKFLPQEYYGWRADEGMAQEYVDICQAACRDDTVFQNFKSTNEYGGILEHVPRELGELYLENISGNNSDIIKEYKKYIVNDVVGNPRKSSYQEYHIPPISPTTIRYMKVLSDLTVLFSDLDGMNIVEIGGGYGGQAFVVSKKYEFKNYYNIDLKNSAKLSKKYCNFHGLNNFIVCEPHRIDELKDVDIDLVISNYAFSECNYETQDVYFEKILSKSKRGYITHNSSIERQGRTKSIIENYNNFRVFDYDLCRKKHPIFVWG